jgi:hypothetical protein
MRTFMTAFGIAVLLGLVCSVPAARAIDFCGNCEAPKGARDCHSAPSCVARMPGFYCKIGTATGKCNDIGHPECANEPGEVCCGCDIFDWGSASVSYEPPVAIPDGDPLGVSTTMDVTESFAFDFLDVWITMDHPSVSELSVTLSHNGVTVALLVGPECPIAVTCDDTLALSDIGIGPIQAPLPECEDFFPGGVVQTGAAYTPSEPLAAFLGLSTVGEWTLAVTDPVVGNSGAICGWSLNFARPPASPNESATWGVIKGLYR